MSVRSERSDSAMTSSIAEVGQMANLSIDNQHVSATINAAQQADSQLGEANAISTSHPDHPLKRTVVATIRSTMSDLCLRRAKATWAPSADALRSILQQRMQTNVSTLSSPPHTNVHSRSTFCTRRQIHRRLRIGRGRRRPAQVGRGGEGATTLLFR